MKVLITLFILAQLSFCASLHIGMSANPSRINPILSTDSVSGELAQYIFNSLITYDENASIKPELAKSYRFLDNKTLLFTLRDDVFWSDGVKFGAQDVVFTYETIISPKVFTPYADSFKHIQKVEALDNLSIKVTYKYPYFAALETWSMGILPYHILKDEESIMTSSFNQNPIGTGAFILKDFSISSNFILEANKNYFLGAPKLERVIYHFAPDSASEFLMLKSGGLDIGSLTPLQVKRQLDEKFHKRFNIYETMSHSYSYVGFNLDLPKFKNARVREALSLAIDRQELIDLLLFGDGIICTGPFMPFTKAFNPEVEAPKRDIKRAKELLLEAGYDEKNPLKFELITNAGPRIYIAQILQQQLKEVNVHVSVRMMEWQAFLNTVVNPRRFEAIVMGWQMGLKPDAYSIWHSESAVIGGFNLVGYKNDEVDMLIKKAERTIDEEEFYAIYRHIFKLIKDDNPYLFLYIPKTLTAVKKEVFPIRPSIIGITHNILEWDKK
ncbi:MAG: peptide-binding protein [Campylobacteraceae bacterium]|jgi:peptide/nickel transport system substrate-binding protein|nr:peptide-binding protein [Campylobacteraceae bacterium]